MEENFNFRFLMSRSDARQNCREVRKNIGGLIARYRSEQGLSLLDMSDALHLPVTLLDAIEGGYGNIKYEHIAYICRFLGLKIDINLSLREGLTDLDRSEEILVAEALRAEQREKTKQTGGDCYIL